MSLLRIIGICSSPRRGNTEILVKEALHAVSQKYKIIMEFISFKGKTILGCRDCKSCISRKTLHISMQCVLKDNWSELMYILEMLTHNYGPSWSDAPLS